MLSRFLRADFIDGTTQYGLVLMGWLYKESVP